jgi:probable HAF family extracellular repeat protein
VQLRLDYRHHRSRGAALRAALLASTFIVAATALAGAADIQNIGTLGGSQTFLGGSNNISSDGTVVVGASNITGNVARHAFRWSGGVMTDIGTLPGGGTYSWAYGVSGNGNVIVGEASIAGDAANHAFSWTAGGGMIDLGTLGGNNSRANAASANGSVIVGTSFLAGETSEHGFRWSGGVMTDLGTLGGTFSSAVGVSADGTVIVGTEEDGSAQYAYRWVGGVMTSLGSLAGATGSAAAAVSADGSTVVGTASHSNGHSHAFRWNGGVMTDLGTFGGLQSEAIAVSANGAVVVGSADDGGFNPTAFRWTAANGMESIKTLLNAAGVNTTGWSLTSASGVSADGTVVIGGESAKVWIARLSSSGTGIITTDEAARSFASLGALGQTGNAAIAGSLGTMSQYATQTQSGGGNPNSQYSVFATGGYDTDPTASGSLGLTMKLGGNMIAGAMVEADYIKTNMATDGSAKMAGGGAGVFLAGIPDTGLQWFTGVSALTIKGDISRGYLNGNTPATSTGSTTANGIGTSARIGWAFDATKAIKLTTYASYTLTSIKYDAYTETTGVFPAQINAFTDTAQTSRLGADARYTLSPGKWLWGGLAWAHRLDGGKTPDISGTLIGLFPINTVGSSFAQDWAEASIGLRTPFGARGAMTASVTASVPEKQATTYLVRLGVSQAF